MKKIVITGKDLVFGDCGYCYKNLTNYSSEEADVVCYIPNGALEMDAEHLGILADIDLCYSRKDLLDICNGNVSLCNSFFDTLDGEFPEHLSEQWAACGVIGGQDDEPCGNEEHKCLRLRVGYDIYGTPEELDAVIEGDNGALMGLINKGCHEMIDAFLPEECVSFYQTSMGRECYGCGDIEIDTTQFQGPSQWISVEDSLPPKTEHLSNKYLLLFTSGEVDIARWSGE